MAAAVLITVSFASCSNFNKALTSPKKKNIPEDAPFIYNNNIQLDITGIGKEEKKNIEARLKSQLEDNAKVIITDYAFLFHKIKKPNKLDTSALAQSAINMKSSLLHLGYYNAATSYKYSIDSAFRKKQKRVYVTYYATANKPTRIEEVRYLLKKPDLQKLAEDNYTESLLKAKDPVTKTAVLGEIGRLVDIYRNNGYFKFTSDELRVRGDTAIEALTTISDDPFDQIEQLQKAQAKRDSPTIKLAVVLNADSGSAKLQQYRVGNIYILTDYKPGDKLTDTSIVQEMVPVKKCDTCAFVNGVYIRARYDLFKDEFVTRSLSLFPGDLLKQNLFNQTLNNFNRAGVWISSNIQVQDRKDSNISDLIIQLIPAPQFDFESSLEFSYSSNSNTNSANVTPAGNLLGIIANASITNRNFQKKGIRSTTSLSTGIELNLKNKTNSNEFINSNDVRLSQSFIYPRQEILRNLIFKRYSSRNTFINFSGSYVNRIALFNLQNFNISSGFNASKQDFQANLKFNVQYSKVYNETDLFKQTLVTNPYLKYSFNTSLVAGPAVSLTRVWLNQKKGNKNTLTINGDFSFLPSSLKYSRSYLKADIDYNHSHSGKDWAFVARAFIGVGWSIDTSTTLPFFKQYFGGGSSSMRGWPVRGIGIGSQGMRDRNTSSFNDRTGDMQFETNIELRKDLFKAFGDVVFFKGALFLDAGNIWNIRNSTPNRSYDSSQLHNWWKEMGMNIGTGLRMDFSYFLIRLDMGFRIKRPDLNETNIRFPSFNKFIPKLFSGNDEYREWRYRNYNFSLGINYPF